MQEIKKRRIVIASVLKPVDEPRMFDRIGKSLAENGFEVFIIGSAPSASFEWNNVRFLSHKKIKRISTTRILVRFKILKQLFSLKPEVMIVATHELIVVALLYKIFTGKKIIYDVQENYYWNILYTDAFPKGIRSVVASLVRFKEIITASFFSKFILAEKCFEYELKFARSKWIVIENKCRLPKDFVRNPSANGIEIIFTGTLAESTGVFQSIDLVKELHSINPKIRLRIVGYCALPKTLSKIKNEIAKHDFITLVGGNDFVSHNAIMQAIGSAAFGIIYYPDSPHTQNRIPSKLYEYLACSLPILLQDKPSWTALAEAYQGCIKVNFQSPDPQSILNKMTSQSFYPAMVTTAYWENEERKLIEVIQSLC